MDEPTRRPARRRRTDAEFGLNRLGISVINVGKSMSDVRISNRAAVLRYLHSHGGQSRKELAHQLNLTQASLTNITAALINEGVLVEGPFRTGSSRSGRKEVILEIDRKHFRALGAYIVDRKPAVFCMDFSGETFFERQLEFDDLASGADIIIEICNVMEEYVAGIGSDEARRIVGVGLAIRGSVDPVNGVSVRSIGMWEDDLPVRAIMEPRLPFLVYVNNSVRCIATAQNLLHGQGGARSMLFLRYGPLLGGAFMIGGDIFDGHSHQAFEVAHTIVDLNGPVCRCGKRGCLETIINFYVIAKHLEIQYSPSRVPILYEITSGDRRNITMETILDAYDRGDRVVVEMIDRVIEFLAMEIVNIMVLINPESIILYGPPFESGIFMKRLLREVEHLVGDTHDTVIMKSLSNLKLDHFGCISIVLKDFLDSGGMLR